MRRSGGCCARSPATPSLRPAPTAPKASFSTAIAWRPGESRSVTRLPSRSPSACWLPPPLALPPLSALRLRFPSKPEQHRSSRGAAPVGGRSAQRFLPLAESARLMRVTHRPKPVTSPENRRAARLGDCVSASTQSGSPIPALGVVSSFFIHVFHVFLGGHHVRSISSQQPVVVLQPAC